MNMLKTFWLLHFVAALAACGTAEVGNRTAIDKIPTGGVFFLNDAQGTPIALADASGTIIERRSHHGFGASRSGGTQSDPHQFVGNELDEGVGISDFNARPYCVDTGHFLAPDPVAVFNPEKVAGDPRRAPAYAYSAGDPINLQDGNGEFFDVVIDVASIGYDLYSIVADNVVGSEDNLGTNLASLGADVVGAVVPFATGGGAAVRAAAHGDEVVKVSRTIFVGGTKAAHSIPTILKGTNQEMARQAVGHLKAFGGTAAEKADFFQAMAGQITAHVGKSSWSASRALGTDGAHVFLGGKGEAIVIDAAGSLYRGTMQNAFKIAGVNKFAIDYAKLSPL